MSITKQIWKYTWNPQGYFEEKIKIDLSKKHKNNTFSLNHTFFKGKDLALYSILETGEKKFYSCKNNMKDKPDFILTDLEEELSKLAGTPIYSKIKVISNRAIQLNEVFCDAYFVADTIDSKSFNQELNQEADVEHNSLSLKDYLLVPKATIDELISNSISGDWGELNKKNIKFNLDTININNTSVSDKGISIEDSETNIKFGSDSYALEFDKNKGIAKFIIGKNREGIVIRGPKTLNDIPVFGIPVILEDDKTKLSFVPWLVLNPEKKGIKLGSLAINDSTYISDDYIMLGKDRSSLTIDLDEINLLLYVHREKTISLFDGALKVNLTTKEITFNNVTINDTFLKDFYRMQKDIQFLKNKIK
ncbi:MAG TPA: hypothetical protein PKI46_00940 [Bacteroidales bacterium]|nr:hypothetical protein [Bacteroidales bacterium]